MSTLRQAAPRSHIGLQHAVSVEEVYPADPATAPQARHLVTSVLRDWGLPALRPDAALVVTELIANAVAQGEAAPPAEVLVRVSRTARYVVIQAGDHNPAGPPRPPRRVRGTAEHGRGLLITRALSDQIGWFREGEWKVVWAAIPKPEVPGEQEAFRGRFGRAA
jgi:anti-sigma regulatory factor (Ser/Thr protein kinase)